MSYKLLIINPGSTSTKVAIFQDKECLFKKNIKHSAEDIAPFEHIADQYHFRKEVILNAGDSLLTGGGEKHCIENIGQTTLKLFAVVIKFA